MLVHFREPFDTMDALMMPYRWSVHLIRRKGLAFQENQRMADGTAAALQVCNMYEAESLWVCRSDSRQIFSNMPRNVVAAS
jgi:hypothetical protein